MLFTLMIFTAEAQESLADVVYPSYPGGIEELELFVEKNIRYPHDGYGGNVYIAFVVDTDGAVLDPQIVQSPSRACGEEAMRLVKKMPNWIAGTKHGKPVRLKHTLAIYFDIDKNHFPRAYWERPVYSTDPLNSSQEVEVEGWKFHSW